MSLATWRDIALIVLVFELFVLALAVGVLALLLALLTQRLQHISRELLRVGQERAPHLAQQADSLSRQLFVEPTIRVYATRTWVTTFARRLRARIPGLFARRVRSRN